MIDDYTFVMKRSNEIDIVHKYKEIDIVKKQRYRYIKEYKEIDIQQRSKGIDKQAKR